MGKKQERSQLSYDSPEKVITMKIRTRAQRQNEINLMNKLAQEEEESEQLKNEQSPVENIPSNTTSATKTASQDESMGQPDSNSQQQHSYDFGISEKEQEIVELVKFYMNGSNFAKYVSLNDIFADPMNSPSAETQEIAMNYFNVQSILKTQVLSDTLFNLLNKQVILLMQNRTRKLLQFSHINTHKLSSDVFYQFDILFYQEISQIIKRQKIKDQYKHPSISYDQTADIENELNYDTHMKAGVGEVLEHWKNQVKMYYDQIDLNKYLTQLENEKNPSVRRLKIYENENKKQQQQQQAKLKNQNDSNEDTETNCTEESTKKETRLSRLYRRHLKKLRLKKLRKLNRYKKKPIVPVEEPEESDSTSEDDEEKVVYNEEHKQIVMEQQEKLKEFLSLQNIFADSQLEKLSQETQLTKICNSLLKDQQNAAVNSKNKDQSGNVSLNSLFNQCVSSSSTHNSSYQTLPSHNDICRSIGKQTNMNGPLKDDNDLDDEDKTKNTVETLPRFIYYDREKIKAFKIYFWRFVFETLSQEHLDQLQLGQSEKYGILKIVNEMRDMCTNANRNHYLKYSGYHSMLIFLTLTKSNIPRLNESAKLTFLHQKIYGIIDFNDQRQLLQVNIVKRIMGEIALMQISQLTKKFTDLYGEELFKPNYIFTECQAIIYYLIKAKTMIMSFLQGIMRFGI